MRFLLLLLLCSFSISAQSVDFKTLDANISVDFDNRSVSGSCEFEFEVKEQVDTIRIDAVSMSFSSVKINKKDAAFKATTKQLLLYGRFKKGKNKLTFEYSATPKQTMYFVGEGESLQVWTQGQGKNTSHWLPSFDDGNEKLIFNISATFHDAFDVISNGILKSKQTKDGFATWKYYMKNPMSSYLVMLAIGKFDQQLLKSASGVTQQLFYQEQDSDKYEPTYRYSVQIFDFLEREIGVRYPWEIYKQIPVRDFLYGGMENTSATIFTQDYVVDAVGFNDRNYANVNAHELAHQWFGDMVTAKSGTHHWLQEGFATYYALLAERDIFGDDYFNWKLYENAEEIQRASQTDSIPILNAKASALTFYKKGAWALHVLRDEVGEIVFRKAVKTYLEKHAFKNVETEDFLSEIKKLSNYDTEAYKRRWLESSRFPVEEALELLNKSAFMRSYFELVGLSAVPFAEKRERLESIIIGNGFYPLKEEAIYQSARIPFADKEAFLKKALATDNVLVRQAVAGTVGKMPESFVVDYATLLDDESYITKEVALRTLSAQFPERRAEFLERTKDVVGLNDRNVRILWLTLALNTREFSNDEKLRFYNELIDYTTPAWEASVRQNALQNLLHISPGDTNVLQSLAHALIHHKWQLTKFARDTIREKLKLANTREFYKELGPSLRPDILKELERLLAE